MIVTKEWLEKKEVYFSKKELKKVIEIGDVKLILKKLINENKFGKANQILSHCLNREDRIRYAIIAAEIVYNIFHDYFQTETSRQAISSAKEYLKNPNEENRQKSLQISKLVDIDIIANRDNDRLMSAYSAISYCSYSVYYDFFSGACVARAFIALGEEQREKEKIQILEHGISLI